MRATLRSAAAVCLLAALATGAGAGAAERGAETTAGLTRTGAPSERDRVPGELLVRFRDVGVAARSTVLSAAGVRPVEALGVPGLVRVEVADGLSVAAAAAELERRAGVLYAEPNYVSRVMVMPNDPRFGQQWGLSQPSDADIDAPSAWNLTTGSAGVVVAVIDTGVAYGHPDLNGNIWSNTDELPGNGADDDDNGFVDDVRGWDFVDHDATPLDFNGHGTRIAGVIGAEGNNGLGGAGVNWDVSIMALRAGDAYGGLADSSVVSAIDYACENGADVVNGSFGFNRLSLPVRDAVTSAACQETLFVFAAGNDGRSLEGNTAAANVYPCELHRPPVNAANVLCVGASGRGDGLAGFSNRGPSAVHLVAPGVDIRSTSAVFPALAAFPERFEGARIFANRWGARAGGPPAWNRSTERRRGGRWSLADSPGGRYPNNRVRSIRRDPFRLSGRVGCGLEYDLWLRSQRNFDGLIVDAGRTLPGLGPLSAYTGATGRWLHFFDDLSPFDGAARVHLRLRFVSNGSVTYDGAYLDNLLVTCLKPGAAGYALSSGTSIAAPFVAGVAALVLANQPGMTVADLKTAVLAGVDVLPGLASHVATGGRLNAARALGLVPDDAGPDTQITAGPTGSVTARRATFAFTGSEPDVSFQCRHMDGAWTPCVSPTTYRSLRLGLHTFRVRALDVNGSADPIPAVRSWRVVSSGL